MGRKQCCVFTVVCLTMVISACGSNSSTTAPSTTTPSVAAPTVTEPWSGTVPVGGSAFYSFSIAQNGTVNVTLLSVSGQFVPSTVTLGLGLGTPSGTTCATSSTTNARAGTTPQVTATDAPGLYCVNVSDVGNLFAPATFSITIAHP